MASKTGSIIDIFRPVLFHKVLNPNAEDICRRAMRSVFIAVI